MEIGIKDTSSFEIEKIGTGEVQIGWERKFFRLRRREIPMDWERNGLPRRNLEKAAERGRRDSGRRRKVDRFRSGNKFLSSRVGA